MLNLKRIFIWLTVVFSFGSYGEDRCVKLENLNYEIDVLEKTCLTKPIQLNQSFTLIEFFTTTCSTCKKNLPHLNRLHEKWQGKLSIKLVSLNPKKEMIEEFIEGYREFINYPVYFDELRKAKRQFKIRLVPTLLLFKEGSGLIFRHKGEMDEDLIEELESLLKE